MPFLKPDGVESFDGALCDEGWILSWSDRQVFAWSAGTGWVTLPEVPSRVEGARGVRGGVVVVCDGQAAFWVHGESRWRWWIDVPPAGAAIFRTMNLSGTILPELLVLHATAFPTNSLWIGRLSPAGFELQTKILDDEPSRFLHAWQDDVSSGDVHLLFENGLYVVRAPLHGKRLEKVRGRTGGGELVPFGREVGRYRGRIVAHRASEPAELLHLDTWTRQPLPLGAPPIHATLWPAYFDEDRSLVGKLLDFVEDASAVSDPKAHWERRPFDVLLAGREPVALATPAGVLPATDVPPAAPEKRRLSWTREDDDYLSWRVWARGGEALEEACLRLLADGVGADMLARAISSAVGEDALPDLLDVARGRPLPYSHEGQFNGVRTLFALHPRTARWVVQWAVADPDPLVLALGCAGCSAPGLWGVEDADFPRSDLLAALAAPAAGVRSTAAESCGRLRLREAIPGIASLLSAPEEEVRRPALAALVAIGDPDERWVVEIERLVRDDPDMSLREAAVEALGRFGRGGATLDALIAALGDDKWSVRSRVADALQPHAEHLSVPQVWNLADSALAQLMTAPRADDSSDFAGADRALAAVPSRLEEVYFTEAPSASVVARAPAQAVEVYFSSVVLLLGLAHSLVPGGEWWDSDKLNTETLSAGVAALGKSHVFSPSDLGLLARPGPLAAGVIARLAVEAERSEPELAARLALLAVVASPPESPHTRRPAPAAAGRPRPLHERLRLTLAGSTPLEQCISRVRERSGRGSIEGAAALLALAFHGDAGARTELGRRILAWEIDDCDVLRACHLESLPQAQRAGFASRFIAAPRVPVAKRAEVARRWNDTRGSLAEDAKKVLWHDIAASHTLDLWSRADAADELSRRGEPEILERLWLEARAKGQLSTEYLSYRCSCDLARLGHADALAGVRGVWLKRGDSSGLAAFAAVGTIDDIPELESAVATGFPESAVHGVIETIRRRCSP